MSDSNFLKNIQTEIDASYLYQILSENEVDQQVAYIFKQMSEIEYSHAIAFSKEYNIQILPKPSLRAKVLKYIGKTFGYDYILGILLDIEKSLSKNIVTTKKKLHAIESISDTSHVVILENILNNHKHISSTHLSRFEKRHRSVGGNALRAAVLGGNDGLISNFSLIMGVVGATNNQNDILLTGIAGLLAGSLSMALGEWISVKSSQELFENQVALEKEELKINPEGEEKELVLIYMSKGILEEQAMGMAKEVMKDKDLAHTVLVKEELGINLDDLKNSAFEAAFFSFLFFAIGAILPVLPFLLFSKELSFYFSIVLSTFGLFFIGASITLFTGKSVLYSGLRQIIFGLLAAAVTFGIGKIIGVSLG
jgi:VIT1/CCC1 family predicted Fe2+/Mn2+ transporter